MATPHRTSSTETNGSAALLDEWPGDDERDTSALADGVQTIFSGDAEAGDADGDEGDDDDKEDDDEDGKDE